jgi:hypothetical protein
MDGDWETVARYVVRKGLAMPVAQWWESAIGTVRKSYPIPAPMPRRCEECHEHIREQLDLQTAAIVSMVTPHARLVRGAPIIVDGD